MTRAARPEEHTLRELPEAPEEMRAALDRMYDKLLTLAEKLLDSIERGHYSPAEREKLIRNYDSIDRILQRHYLRRRAERAEDDDTLLEVLRRWDEAAQEEEAEQ